MRWNDAADWIWSADVVHEALVSPEDFARVQAGMAASAHRPTAPKRRTDRPYVPSRLVRCGLWGRRKPRSWNHSAPHYRCVLARQYAAVKGLDHPKAI